MWHLLTSKDKRGNPTRPLRERVFVTKQNLLRTNSLRDLTNINRPLVYKRWNEEKMSRALEAVAAEGLSVRRAALMYGVPKSTLGDRVSGRVLPGSMCGREKYLTDEEEEELSDFIENCAALGYAKTRKQVLALVERIMCTRGIEIRVTDGWWASFLKRHPSLSLRTPASVSTVRAAASDPNALEVYFDLLEETLDENELHSSPGQIYNMDETGLPLDPKPPKTVHRKGTRNAVACTSGGKSQITAVGCVNAAGQAIPPMVIWDRKTMAPALAEGEVPGTIYGLSPKGWMDQELFDLWFTCHFLRYASRERPLLLILDGHSSHYCPDTIRLASEENVVVFTLPPNTTHLTQPLDKGVFGPLKSIWKDVCHSFLVSHPGRSITKYDFSRLFGEAWIKAMTPKNILSGFAVTGICPLDRNALSVGVRKSPDKPKLPFIPLFTPSKRVSLSHSPKRGWFTHSEAERFESLYRCGKDLESVRYQEWLKMYHSEDFVEQKESGSSSDSSTDNMDVYKQASRQSALKKFLVLPHPPTRKSMSSKVEPAARILTSAECLQQMKEKEEIKEEKRRRKEENARKRELKRAGQLVSKQASKSTNGSACPAFTVEEQRKFETRYENGYDLPDERYSQWLQKYHPPSGLHVQSHDLCTVESSDSEPTATTSRAARSRVKGKKGPGVKTVTRRIARTGTAESASADQLVEDSPDPKNQVTNVTRRNARTERTESIAQSAKNSVDPKKQAKTVTRRIAHTGTTESASADLDQLVRDDCGVHDVTLMDQNEPLHPGEITLDNYSMCDPLLQWQLLFLDDLDDAVAHDESSISPSLRDVESSPGSTVTSVTQRNTQTMSTERAAQPVEDSVCPRKQVKTVTQRIAHTGTTESASADQLVEDSPELKKQVTTMTQKTAQTGRTESTAQSAKNSVDTKKQVKTVTQRIARTGTTESASADLLVKDSPDPKKLVMTVTRRNARTGRTESIAQSAKNSVHPKKQVKTVTQRIARTGTTESASADQLVENSPDLKKQAKTVTRRITRTRTTKGASSHQLVEDNPNPKKQVTTVTQRNARTGRTESTAQSAKNNVDPKKQVKTVTQRIARIGTTESASADQLVENSPDPKKQVTTVTRRNARTGRTESIAQSAKNSVDPKKQVKTVTQRIARTGSASADQLVDHSPDPKNQVMTITRRNARTGRTESAAQPTVDGTNSKNQGAPVQYPEPKWCLRNRSKS